MDATDVYDHLRSLDDDWVDWDDTVDTFKQGDPNAEVEGIAVGWMSYTWALERAAELGCNLFVTHEATYYDHFVEPAPENFPDAIADQIESKVALVDDLDMTILRCHDVWDEYPGLGVPDTWGEQLEFAEPGESAAVEDGYYRVYELESRTARDVAEQVARNTRPYGQEAVQLLGPADADVSRVVIGTGAITPVIELVDRYDPDLLVCSDDGLSYWTDGALATDMGLPIVAVNHATSEVASIGRLAEHLDETFPEVPVHHIEQECNYELIEAQN
ncbi:Nif3-like dinuclear metal center hexameric protein [Halomontanus rarus]|uniref:Nif3-like dinuclear metal center hexameric protein n=1 Tax=Halomontanus rarus TaxID=3034020 RepID=UPI0023E762E9|nr:Nif3-like dinuclear metal center hexameric protein [Halovivax sp. TS33]